jgi:polyferredoxin
MNVRLVRNLRRASQLFFLLLFCWFVLKTTFEVDFAPTGTDEITLPWPVSFFLQLDPLAALTTILSSWTLYKGMFWAVGLLVATVFLGRFFCGWVCPMGTLNHALSEVSSKRASRKGKARIDSNRFRPYQRLKYYILFGTLVAALFGSALTGILDPLSLLARSLGTVVLPTLHTAALAVRDAVKEAGWPPLSDAAQASYDLVASFLLPFRQAHFQGVLLLGLLLALVLVANGLVTRFWCRGLCPLGALLGLFSRFGLLGLKKDEASCTHCNRCLQHCQGGDNPVVGEKWRQSECHLCLNCQASCPEGSLKFTLFPQQEATAANPEGTPQVDLVRRSVLLSLGAGAAAVPLLRSGDSFRANASPRRIRPPGAREEKEFLARCIRCGQCMRVCPNNALHPTLLEAGAEGIWTPVMIARIGYCEPSCTLCGQVCPTGAIAELTKAQKVGDEETPPSRIGTAFVDRGRCLPWAMSTPCIVCEEWCPTSPKAVYLEEVEVTDREGRVQKVKRPHIDPALCTGCGACEYACPVHDKRAIRITAVGESRSYENQIIPRKRPRPASAPGAAKE